MTPCGSVEPFGLTEGPNGVPDSRPLPVGSGGGASFWRAALTGGVGALEFDGVEFVFFIGTDVLGATSESISMGAGPSGTVGRGGGGGGCCCWLSWSGRGGPGRVAIAAGDTGADVTEACCCSLTACGYVELAADGGSIRLLMDGDALARLRGGEMGGGTVAALGGFVSKRPPRMGS